MFVMGEILTLVLEGGIIDAFPGCGTLFSPNVFNGSSASVFG